MSDKQAIKLERRQIAKYLREGRMNAGFPTANHASIKFGWGLKTYLQHEEAIKSRPSSFFARLNCLAWA